MAQPAIWECESCGERIDIGDSKAKRVIAVERAIRNQNDGEMCCDDPDYEAVNA